MNNKEWIIINRDFINKIDHNTFPIDVVFHEDSCSSISYHEELEFILVIEGSIKVNIRNETSILKEEDFILINGNETHSITSLSKNRFVSLKINIKVLTKYFPSYNYIYFKCNSIFENDNNKYIYDKMRNLIANVLLVLVKRENGFELKACSYVYLIGEHLYNNFEVNKRGSKYSEVRKDNRIDNIINFINEKYNTNITLSEVASEFNLNYHFLSHCIKDNIGMSFQNYLNKIRLEKSVNMVLQSDKNMTEIAIANGFSSTSYFYKVFKNEYNCTPLEYRKIFADKGFNRSLCNIRNLSLDNKDVKSVIQRLYPYYYNIYQ
ncbi:MAG: helix-turn-helix domain-containing protein [Clostridioides difficile]|nr:AraC family transcriptional regulator [Clostridioides sp.]MBS5787980.1 helix-turn-helix domain-containing protein [Clostridioides difficile]